MASESFWRRVIASIDQPRSHREGLGVVVELAERRFAIVAVLITIGAPVAAYPSGIPSLPFYVHVALGAFWFGLDIFFKFGLGPSIAAIPDEAAGAVNHRFVPKMITVAEPLSVGVIGLGIALADLLGYWANPSVWLWGALVIGVQMLTRRAADMIPEATLAVQYGLTIDDIIDTVHPFPTFSEGFKYACQAFRRDVSTMSCCVE